MSLHARDKRALPGSGLGVAESIVGVISVVGGVGGEGGCRVPGGTGLRVPILAHFA